MGDVLVIPTHQPGHYPADVHAISSLDDEYNRDFMAAAHILFMSDALLPAPPDEWARQVLNRFGNEVVVVSMWAEGAPLAAFIPNP